MTPRARNTSKEAALDLARRGVAVFPLKPKSKVPATSDGFKSASKDPETIEKLFAKREDYNLGIATGPASGLWVLDLDDGPKGLEALARREEKYGPLPETVSARTPGDKSKDKAPGEHRFFRLNGVEIKNRTKVGGDPIDVRGDGGYVVGPPSRTDGPYEWINSPDEVELVEAPDWLTDLVTSPDSDLCSFARKSSGLTFEVGEDLDLASDPGAPAGNRHAQALKLIGSALGRGLDPVEVANQATAWARRCSPPVPDEEVLKIVGDLARKQGTKISDELDSTPLPPPPDWPKLDERAYHGLLGDLCRTIEPETESDSVAILAQLIVSVGSVAGRYAHYMVEGTPHFANTFAVLCGSTARGRKGTSEGRVRSIFREVDLEWSQNRISTGLVSGEGLIWACRDPIFKTEESGLVVADPGEADKRLLIVESEFCSVLRICKRETNTLSPTIRSAWDTGNLRTLAKNSPAKSTGAHISIVGHTTREELHKALAEVEAFSGFGNRFLWLAVRRSKLLPEGGRDLDLSRYVERLRAVAQFGKSAGRMYRSDSAAKLWRTIYRDLATGSTGLVGAITSRAEAQVLRLSMIYALSDCSTTISVEHLEAAHALWRYAHDSARLIFGGSTGSSLADKLLKIIREEPGINRKELHNRTGRHHKATVLVAALAELRDLKLVESRTESTGGRSAEVWLPTGEQSELSEAKASGLSSHGSLSSQPSGEIEEVRI